MIAEKYTICGLDLCVTNKNVENSSKKFPYFCIFKLNQHVEKKIAQQLPSIIRPKISHSFFFFFVELLFWVGLASSRHLPWLLLANFSGSPRKNISAQHAGMGL